MTFPPVRLARCFPELHGFVLLDPVRLASEYGPDAEGADLLDRFSTSEAGDAVARAGVALPVLRVEAGYYTVLVRHASTPSPLTTPRVCSPGWVLGTDTGELLLCGIGYLKTWAPSHPAHHRVSVPPGWYAVDIRGYCLEPGVGADDGAYEFVLTPVPAQPPFSADLGLDFDVINPNGAMPATASMAPHG